MDDGSDFYTFQKHKPNSGTRITSSMEDYLEMICRLFKKQDIVRINELAEKLHVRPSSASKMVGNLKYSGLVTFEKYGYIKPTDSGFSVGEYLLYRHDVLNRLLCLINKSENETEQVEKIEHFFDENTVRNIDKFLKSKI
ncbi:MAG: metal-dependent transcriptional regulator [Eubacteriales bacterium]|nr:metal-dependent transcriptional regulator [Eubacteriales bacterium]